MPRRSITEYQPKGGMCVTCRVQRDCSSLPFDHMPIIEIVDSIATVRCINHQPFDRGNICKPPTVRKAAS